MAVSDDDENCASADHAPQKFTVLFMAEIEVEDEGFLDHYIREAFEKGQLQNLRIATLRELYLKKWGETFLLKEQLAFTKAELARDNSHGGDLLPYMCDFPICKEVK